MSRRARPTSVRHHRTLTLGSLARVTAWLAKQKHVSGTNRYHEKESMSVYVCAPGKITNKWKTLSLSLSHSFCWHRLSSSGARRNEIPSISELQMDARHAIILSFFALTLWPLRNHSPFFSFFCALFPLWFVTNGCNRRHLDWVLISFRLHQRCMTQKENISMMSEHLSHERGQFELAR